MLSNVTFIITLRDALFAVLEHRTHLYSFNTVYHENSNLKY